MSHKRAVSVFGNPNEPGDSLAVRLVPRLQKRFPEIEFRIEDPTENLEPHGDPWVIVDVAMGVDEVAVIEDLNQLEYVKGQSVHDFDVYMELRLKEKLGELPAVRLVLIPSTWEEKKLTAVAPLLKSLLVDLA